MLRDILSLVLVIAVVTSVAVVAQSRVLTQNSHVWSNCFKQGATQDSALHYLISLLASVSKVDKLEESEVAERKTSGRQKWHLRIAKSLMIIAYICDLSG